MALQSVFGAGKERYSQVAGPGLGWHGPQDIYKPPVIQSTGGGGGQAPTAPTAPTGGGTEGRPSFETPPAYQEPEFDIGPAMAALEQSEAALKQSLTGAISGVETGVARELGREEEAGIATRAGAERQITGRKAEGAEATAKTQRQAEEMQTGIQARFGGTTGTGKFSSEILGRQAMENIASYRTQVQKFVSDVNWNLQASERASADRIADIERTGKDQKMQLNAAYQTTLANIASSKAELGLRKAEVIEQARRDYRSLSANIEARNAEAVRAIEAEGRARNDALIAARAKANASYAKNQEAYDKFLQQQAIKVFLASEDSGVTAEQKGAAYQQLRGVGFDEDLIPTGETTEDDELTRWWGGE